MAHPNRLQNAHVLVFGGTSGIGFAVANMALSSGASVTISGSQQPKVDEKVALLRSYYPDRPSSSVSGYAVNLLDKENLEGSLTAMFDTITKGGTKMVDHVAFTAGDIPALPGVKDITPEAILSGFHIRLVAAAIVAKLLGTGTYMALTPSSSYTLTGGVAAKRPDKGRFIAAAWGASIEGLTRGLAVDLAPVRVNMVEPGAVETELWARFAGSGAEGERRREVLKGRSLTGTIGRPENVAEAYAWCMRDGFVTGAVAATSGGRLLADPEGL